MLKAHVWAVVDSAYLHDHLFQSQYSTFARVMGLDLQSSHSSSAIHGLLANGGDTPNQVYLEVSSKLFTEARYLDCSLCPTEVSQALMPFLKSVDSNITSNH